MFQGERGEFGLPVLALMLRTEAKGPVGSHDAQSFHVVAARISWIAVGLDLVFVVCAYGLAFAAIRLVVKNTVTRFTVLGALACAALIGAAIFASQYDLLHKSRACSDFGSWQSQLPAANEDIGSQKGSQ